VVEAGDAGPVQPVRGAGGVGGLVERGGIVGLAAGELSRCGQGDLVADDVVAGVGAGGVHESRAAGGEVAVEHVLRLPGQVRPGRRLGGAVPGRQVIGLLGVEHPEGPQQRHRAEVIDVRIPALTTRVVADFELLPEDDLDRVLAAADLAAQLADLPVGAPPAGGVAAVGGGQAEEQGVDAAVGPAGGHRRGPTRGGCPGLPPRDGACFQGGGDPAGHLLV
jgi:hypothetical protein